MEDTKCEFLGFIKLRTEFINHEENTPEFEI